MTAAKKRIKELQDDQIEKQKMIRERDSTIEDLEHDLKKLQGKFDELSKDKRK